MQIGGGQNRLEPNSQSSFTHSHKLPKIALSLALLFSSANIVLAEESSAFIGFGIGGGGAKYSIKQKFDGSSAMMGDSYHFGGINYGFVAGYKHFFMPHFWLRYYANADIYHNLSKFKDREGNSYKYDAIAIHHGINVDFLGNFISNEMLDFGGFVGVGIGTAILVGEEFKFSGLDLQAGETGIRRDIGLDVALNVGVRANIAKYHGVELVERVPFIPVKFIEIKQTGGGDYDSITTYSFGQTFSILARYTFSF